MKLISMTEFVIEQYINIASDNISTAMINCKKYARFLQQPLKLWMLIPCDSEKKCLFKGFELIDERLILNGYTFAVSSNMDANIDNYGTVEKLLYHYLGGDIELTTAALKKVDLRTN